ncbi:MAG: hypothetical protein SGPRY_011562, partial [Prymnesium sp.]
TSDPVCWSAEGRDLTTARSDSQDLDLLLSSRGFVKRPRASGSLVYTRLEAKKLCLSPFAEGWNV